MYAYVCMFLDFFFYLSSPVISCLSLSVHVFTVLYLPKSLSFCLYLSVYVWQCLYLFLSLFTCFHLNIHVCNSLYISISVSTWCLREDLVWSRPFQRHVYGSSYSQTLGSHSPNILDSQHGKSYIKYHYFCYIYYYVY